MTGGPSRVVSVDLLAVMSIEAPVVKRLRSVWPSLVLLAMGATAVGCTSAAGQESRGATSGDWDSAVGYTQHALESDARRHQCRIALERAMISPSRQHIPAGRAFELQEPPAALREYRAAAACDPSYSEVVSDAVTRARVEATRPPAPLEAMPRLARRPYDEPPIQAFDISHVDRQAPAPLLDQIVQVPRMAMQPSIVPSTLGNTITLPATVISIVERVIAATDRPLAAIVIDVEILEVNRDRTRHYGLNLTDYALAASRPEVAPPTDALPPSAAGTPQSFNVSTVSRGDSATDLYLGVGAAVARALETDSETKRVARPQLRGQEGQTMTFSLGGDVPVPTTAVTPIGLGGVVVQPLTAFDYRPVGIVVEITPRVTFEGEIILDLTVENSSLVSGIDGASNSPPTFETRKVATRLRLRDAESGLLTGLLREQDRETLAGPGVLGAPLPWSPLDDTGEAIRQTDIVMLLTPRIVRTRELTPRHIDPIHIGARTNLARAAPPAPNRDADSDADPPTPTAPPPLATDPAPAPLPAPVRLKLARGLVHQKPARLRLTRWLSGREPLQEQPAGSGTEAGTGLEFTRTLLD